ncbi:hypothetical protein D6D21_08069 [Aureobasidium pullulans]|uniref:Uncharacterized protein n=1 Tax=Aureobasidium pullulans TaxID=5580 RepID=A0A4S9ZCI3_AURPU|nr:hypothetical protein D6D21_08069 [Aureobasidium pullulans]THX33474.1 hypothetical protein D6D10_07834 [Aureobasidium pullulans]TIA02382.1 hypothetical protein D6C82_02796 [Aureobasidium pullulans]
MLNGTLVASAARLHRVREELLSTLLAFASLTSDLRRAAAVRIARSVAYAALRAQIRREFEEHMKRDNRPVTVMTSAGLVKGNDAWLCEQPIPGLPERTISQQPHLHDGR